MRLKAVRNSIVALVVTALTALGPLVSIAEASSYTYNCDGTQHLTHDIITKDFTPTAFYIKAAAGDAAVRQLDPCNKTSDTFGSGWDEPFVWLADIQKTNSGTDPNIVQIGYARCGWTGFLVDCGGTPGDNNMYMVYTDSDHSGGQIRQANWYNGGNKLTLGDRYRGKITRITSGCPSGQTDCWQICARNITSGQSYQCTTIDYTWSTLNGGNFAWWGAETNNYASQMGVTAAGSDFTEDYMQYLSSQSGAVWTVRTGMTACELPEGNPSFYHCNIGTTVYTRDTLFAWTALH